MILEQLRGVDDPLGVLAELFAHAPVGIQVFTSAGRSVLTNAAHRAIFGSAPPPDYNIFEDNLVRERGILALVERAFAGEAVDTPAIWYDTRELTNVSVSEGRRAAVAATFLPVRGRQGDVTHVAIVFKDVTAEMTAREEAERERDLLRAIVAQSGDGIIVADEDGALRIFNPAAERQHGQTHQQVKSQEWASTYRLLALDHTPLPLEQIPLHRATRGEVVADARWIVHRPDGELRTLQGTATPLRKPDGSLAGAVLVARDVTNQQRMEEELRAGEALFRRIFESGVVGVVFTHDDGAIIDANDALLAILGRTRAELDARELNWAALTPPEWHEANRKALALLQARGVAPPFEKEYLRKDGTRARVLVGVARVHEQARNVTLVVDISARKAAEDRLQLLADASRRLSASLDADVTLAHLAEAVVTAIKGAMFSVIDAVEPDGTLRRRAAAHGDPAKHHLAQTAMRYAPRLDGASPYRAVIDSKRTQVIADFRGARPTAARDDAHAAFLAELDPRMAILIPIIVRDEVIGVLSMSSSEPGGTYADADIVLAEELALRAGQALENARLYKGAQDAIALRDDFLSIASHELKTPLTALELTLGAFAKNHALGKVDVIPAEKAVRIAAQVARLGRLVGQLLDVSRLTAGKLVLQHDPTDLAALVSKVVASFAEQAQRAGSALTFSAEGETHASVDSERIDQVVTNLVANALKFGEGRPVDVRVEGRASGVVIQVRDRGMGIEPAEHARVFERFARTSSARAVGGMGLGLWITQAIVSAHGGSIGVVSAVGAGATFSVELPRSQPYEDFGSRAS